MEAQYFKAMASDGIRIVGVYKAFDGKATAIYFEGSCTHGLTTASVSIHEKATEKEFNDFRKLAIKKLQLL